MGGLAKSDIICFFIAISGIISWQLTKNPILALYFALAADFTGFIPTLIKTYHLPKTEVWLFYSLDVIAALFNLLATRQFIFNQFLYPLYIILVNLLMVILIIAPRKNKKF
jgi:hypothetical protein